MSNEQIQLKLADLPPGSVKCIVLAGEPVAVANVKGEIFAIHDTCTHAQASLSEGPLSNYELRCPWHGATFDVRTGMPTSGPATEPCRRYTTQLSGDTITILNKTPFPTPPPRQK